MRSVLHDERGSTLLMVAASLLVLMGFAALAVDWGFGVNQRRADQNGADFGALAAVQKAQTTTTGTCNQAAPEDRAACNGAEAAMDIVNQNLTFTPDWTQANCDTTKPPEYVIEAPNTNCIWFTSSLDRAWVSTPTVAVDTFFARAFGVDSVDTDASAEAGGRSLLGGAVLPFGVPAGLANTSYECLRSGSHPQWGPCAGGITGNYGSLDISLYGTEEFVQFNGNFVPTDTRCAGQTQTRLEWNIRAGVDHPMTTWSIGDPTINDRLNCPAFNAGPNQIAGQTGIGSALDKGLFDSSSTYSENGTVLSGRLSRGGNQIEIKPGVFADDTPLWDSLVAGVCTGVPGVSGIVDDHAEMELCLDAWYAGSVTGVIFQTALGTEPRFGFAPQLHTDFSAGTSDYFITAFRPVFLDTTWYKCTGSGGCDTVHSPGEIDPSITNPTDSCSGIVEPVLTCGLTDTGQDVAALSSYLLHPSMLPASLRDPSPGAADQLAYNLTR